MSVLSEIETKIGPGTVIPKPQAKADFTVKGWGKRRGERALIYTIPNHRAPAKPYEKGVTNSEWERAFKQLTEAGDFTRAWFGRVMTGCSAEGDCNFTTIGGVFVMLGYALYDRRGVYRSVSRA